MSIKFSCPHCKKTLKVADSLAGKKGVCPGCKKLIQIPAQTVYIPSASLSGSGSSVTDIEAMAAAALAEQRQEAGVAREIDYTCPYCDEAVKFPLDAGGKQTPCPACKRIVKVPVLVKTGPRDWRKPDEQRMPSGAKRDDVSPDGAWGTEAARGVSRQALVEADVIKEEREPFTVRQLVFGCVAVTILIIGIALATVFWFGWTKEKLDKKAVALAQDVFKNPKVDLATKAELERILGIFHESAKKDPADQTGRQRLMKARQALGSIADANERMPVIRELLFTQVELGIDHEEMGGVLALTPPGEFRELVVREVCRRALANGRDVDVRAARIRMAITQGVTPVTRQRAGPPTSPPSKGGDRGGAGVEIDATEQTACLAILGQELVVAGKTQAAQKLADEIRQRYQPTDPFPLQLNALLIMVNKPEIEGKQDQESAALASRAEGNARLGVIGKSMDIIEKVPQFAPPTVLRLNTLLAVADVLSQKDQKPRALKLLKDCQDILNLFREETTWQRQRLVEQYLAAGDPAEAERVAVALLAGNALDRARLAILRSKLPSQAADPALVAGFNQKSSGYHVAVYELARAKAATDGGDAMTWAESLESDSAKGFAAVGAAAGAKQTK